MYITIPSTLACIFFFFYHVPFVVAIDNSFAAGKQIRTEEEKHITAIQKAMEERGMLNITP